MKQPRLMSSGPSLFRLGQQCAILFLCACAGMTVASESKAPASLEAAIADNAATSRATVDLLQRRVRLVVYGKAGAGGKRPLLRFEQPAAKLVGERILLFFSTDQPGSGPQVLRERLRPMLSVGRRIIRGKTFGGRGAGGQLAPAGRLSEVFGALESSQKAGVLQPLSLS